jgi:hypothetical protein
MARHIVLLGDSIFDNRAYTGAEPEVASHLKSLLPESWQVTLCAVDGATTASFHPQLRRVPAGASHLTVAVGGNDALGNLDLLASGVVSTTEALLQFADRLARFEHAYRSVIAGVLAWQLPTTICTIYNGNLPSGQARPARIGLMLFNDVILRVAFEHRLRVIDLRLVCTESADYANPIEPSGRGGRKIAAAIVQSVEELSPHAARSMVFSAADG